MQIHVKHLGFDKMLALHNTDVIRCGCGRDVHLDRKQETKELLNWNSCSDLAIVRC